MAEPILCVSWNDYAIELATAYKLYLENDFFVDCTLAAEGQCLKAHRLILSACSPYFCMLFRQEREKHPIVILKDTLFDTLKRVIDFVYYGKAEIPASKLQPFLELAAALQIKGLNNAFQTEGTTDKGNADGNVHHGASRFDQDIRVVRSSWQGEERSSSNSSRQCNYYPVHPVTIQENTSMTLEECRGSCEMITLQDPLEDPLKDDGLPHIDSVVSSNTVIVKSEPLDPDIEIVEFRSNIGDDVEQGKATSSNLKRDLNERPASASEQDSRGLESLHSNESLKKWQEPQPLKKHQLPQLPQQMQQHASLLQSREQLQQEQQQQQQQQQQQREQLQLQGEHQQPKHQMQPSQGLPSSKELQQQQFTCSSYDMSSPPGLAKSPPCGKTVGEQSIPMDVHDVAGNAKVDDTKRKREQDHKTHGSFGQLLQDVLECLFFSVFPIVVLYRLYQKLFHNL